MSCDGFVEEQDYWYCDIPYGEYFYVERNGDGVFHCENYGKRVIQLRGNEKSLKKFREYTGYEEGHENEPLVGE
jgi:hypothetical protein